MTKIWRVWLKNWVCHTLLNFKIKMGIAGSIFELHPPNFVKIHIFWIPTNDIKTIFCWLYYYRIWKKDDPVLRPGVKESMAKTIGTNLIGKAGQNLLQCIRSSFNRNHRSRQAFGRPRKIILESALIPLHFHKSQMKVCQPLGFN